MNEIDWLDQVREEVAAESKAEYAQYLADVAAGKYAEQERRQAEADAKQEAEIKREHEEAAAKEAAFRATPEGKALTKAEAHYYRELELLEEIGGGKEGGGLPRWLEELCDSPPPAGEGVHKWLFQMGRQLHAHFHDLDELFRFMRQKADRAERVVTDREIQGAIDYSADCAWGMTGPVDLQKIDWDKRRPWPEPDLKKIAEIVNKGAGLSHLIKSSPLQQSSL